ncbi:MAG TPA: dihydrofolate reductase family protein, partial [Pyrinomonadaceae bacterium]|nr:dihydrofolate reductase family protein [Pyrinomonadaceae bacterium]
ISGKEAAGRVQELRYESDAILVGGNTAVVDDPNLTDRSGKKRRRKLVRVVLDNRLRISENSKLVQTAHETPTIVVSNSTNEVKVERLIEYGVDVVREDSRDLNAVLDALKKRDLQSVLVEGGTAIAGAFVDARLLDKFSFIFVPIIIGGHSAPLAIGGKGANSLEDMIRVRNVEITKHGEDFEVTGYPI